MKRKSLIDRIRINNDKFLNMSKNEKKVEIAKDVLARLEIGNIEARQWCFFDFYEKEVIKEDLKSVINHPKTVCKVCAKGSFFLALVGRTNDFKTTQLARTFEDNSKDSSTHEKLQEIFTLEELDEIETFFEGQSYINIISDETCDKLFDYTDNVIDTLSSKTYEEYHTILLKEICYNIIANKGKFDYESGKVSYNPIKTK